jgi:Tfp pilus assembly protein PilF
MSLNEFGGGNFGGEFLSFDRNDIECETMFTQADLLLKEEKVQESVETLFKILQRNPKFGKAFNHLAWIYENKYKNYTHVEEYYKNAMKYSPEYAASYLNYIYFLSNNGRFEDLKEHLEKALTIPNVSKELVYSEYAIMYEMQENPEQAIVYYTKAAMTTFDKNKI